jgi:hypothetical protein
MPHIPGIFCFEFCATLATVDIIDGDGVDTAPKVGLAVEVTVVTVGRVAVGVEAGGVALGVSIDADAIDNLARVRSKGYVAAVVAPSKYYSYFKTDLAPIRAILREKNTYRQSICRLRLLPTIASAYPAVSCHRARKTTQIDR